ncbi:MAG: 30S ribosomal protein S17e [Candidatus Nitrosocaldus sp.]
MNRIRRIAMQLLEKYDGMFSTDFESNKELLEKIAVFRSKELRNEVAGYITRHIMRKSTKTSAMDDKDSSGSSGSSGGSGGSGGSGSNLSTDEESKSVAEVEVKANTPSDDRTKQ